jgi:aspartyl aminopeptidase
MEAVIAVVIFHSDVISYFVPIVGLWGTWFDRELSLAGRAVVRLPDGKFQSRLVDLKKPLLCIPNLAIHLNRAVAEVGFNPNKEVEIKPILATVVKAQLEERKIEHKEHHSALMNTLASELSVRVEDIQDFELCAYDVVPAKIGGLFEEFIHARALDNQMMSFVALSSLIDASADAVALASSPLIHVVTLFDNEEIGSQSFMGADSNMMLQTCERMNSIASDAKGAYDSTSLRFEQAMRKSILISADMAHGVHPNYDGKHEENHRPAIHGGLVIKQNCNLRYATNSLTTFLLSQVAARHNLPLQKFVVRNDSLCGSTIGPILSAQCGLRTLDVGIPQLAMHSVREMCGVDDVYSSYELFKAFFLEYSTLDATLDAGDM